MGALRIIGTLLIEIFVWVDFGYTDKKKVKKENKEDVENS